MESQVLNLLILPVMFIAMYFLMIRPSSKRRKEEQEMRNSITIGDEITTIGGIVGKVIGIKDDNESLIIETGADRSKIKIKKWAVATRENNNTVAESK